MAPLLASSIHLTSTNSDWRTQIQGVTLRIATSPKTDLNSSRILRTQTWDEARPAVVQRHVLTDFCIRLLE